MKTEQELEDQLRQTAFGIPAEIDARVLADAAAALRPIGGWQRWARRAAVILLPIGVAVAVLAYLDRPGLTLAEVATEFAKKTWVHVAYDSGREDWENQASGQSYSKNWDGVCVSTEANGTELIWNIGSSYIIHGPSYRGPASSVSAWNRYVEGFVMPAGSRGGGVDAVDDTLDGRPVTRFDAYFIDLLGRRVLTKQAWADRKTHLPIQVREILQGGQADQQKRQAVVGRFDFPTTGPCSIYDIGVSRTLPIVDGDARQPKDVADLIAHGKAAREKFPTTYRMVVWGLDDEMGSADLIYLDGKKSSHVRCFQVAMAGVPKFPGGGAVAPVLNWFGAAKPMEQNVNDGQREIRRQNNVFAEAGKPAANAQLHGVQPSSGDQRMDDSNNPPGTSWSYVMFGWGPDATIIDSPKDQPGIVVLQVPRGDERTEYRIDPARDWICTCETRQRRTNGAWQDARVTTFADFTQLPNGTWFAGTRHVSMAGDPALHTHASSFTERIDLQILKPGDIPAGTFDVDAVLKGAAVQTY